MHCVRLAVYGPPAVGKTALCELLVHHCVQPLRPRTGQDRVYSLTALFDGTIYCVTLLDMHSDLTEAVRPVTADAYILMFDLMSPGQYAAASPLPLTDPLSFPSSASFQYVRLLRDQMRLYDSGTPVFVVGNKADCAVPAAISRLTAAHPEHGHHHTHHHHHHHHHHHSADLPVAFKDLSALIRKQWKWSYAEVSVLRDWHVQSLFRRVLQSVSQSEGGAEDTVPPVRLSAPPSRSPHCRLL
jgi:GTPase SAR1 family protein